MIDPHAPVFPRPMVLLSAVAPQHADDLAPPLLELFLRRYGALPKHLIILSIRQTRTPYVPDAERYQVAEFQETADGSASLLSISASFGFRESVDVEDVIDEIMANRGVSEETSRSAWMIHAAKERIVGARDYGALRRARHAYFKTLRRQAEPAYSYFGLDDDARLTVELVPVVI